MAKSSQEYEAEAMLLGMGYDHVTHTFFKYKQIQDGFLSAMEFDADTMEPLFQQDIDNRVKERINIGLRNMKGV